MTFEELIKEVRELMSTGCTRDEAIEEVLDDIKYEQDILCELMKEMIFSDIVDNIGVSGSLNLAVITTARIQMNLMMEEEQE